MKSFASVSSYITKAPKENQEKLRLMREIIHTIVPDAQEHISYGMPAYSWKNKPLCYFAAMKGHLGFYPTSGPIASCAKHLLSYKTSKGCVRFSWKEPLEQKIITMLIKARMKDILQEIKHEHVA